MTLEDNIFLAKKRFSDLVCNAAYIEGVDMSFQQIKSVLNGKMVQDVSAVDVRTVLNLRDAWRFCIDSLSQPLTLDYVCQINAFVSRNESLDWGHLRTGHVGVGTDYLPPIPEPAIAQQRVAEISKMADRREAAKALFCYIVHAQLFWDGNKRTATIAANRLLIADGQGILTIGKAKAPEFNEALLHYYDTADCAPLKRCLEGCING